MFDKLFTPLKYIKIHHPEKRLYDYVFPLITAAITTIVFILISPKIKIVGPGGLILLVNGILQILSGFYIASLAAVATFQRSNMDELMEGTPPTYNNLPLTRRMFLTKLFGYLAFISIFIYFFGGAVELMQHSFSKIPTKALIYIQSAFIFMYTLAVSNIIFTTILGMHFMIERLNKD